MIDKCRKICRLIKSSLDEEKKRPGRQLENEELEFLPAAVEILETPPSRFARLLATTISLLLVLAIALTWFGYIDTEAVAQGRTVPAGQVKTIQPLAMAKVEEIYVREGQRVTKGQLLIKFDPTDTEVDVKQVSTDLLENLVNYVRIQLLLDTISQLSSVDNIPRINHDRLLKYTSEDVYSADSQLLETQQKLLEHDYRFFVSADQALLHQEQQKEATIKACEAEIKRLEVLAPLYEKNEKNIRDLFNKGHVSNTEWLSIREKQIDTSQRLLVERSRLQEEKAALLSMNSQRLQFQQEYLQTRMTALNEFRQKWNNASLTLEKAREWDQRCYLRASVDGVIEHINIHTIGGVVEPAQILMTLVPDNEPIEVEAFLENKDIGFVKVGQIVDIKFETYPYTYYGSLTGKIRYLSSHSLDQSDGERVYPVRVVLDQQNIKIGSKVHPLQVGMSLTAEIKTGKRRLLEYFMSPLLRYQDETLRER